MKTGLKDIISKTGTDRDRLLPVMQEVIRQENYLSESSMKEIAEAFSLSAAEIYGVATFYSFIDVSRLGRNIIRICKTISCDLKGKDEIIAAVENTLRIKLGETTPDRKFTFLQTNCIGWCHNSPAMIINDKVYTELTPEKAVLALEEWD